MVFALLIHQVHRIFQLTTRRFYCVIKALDPQITNLVRVQEINIAYGYSFTIPNALRGTIYRVGPVGMWRVDPTESKSSTTLECI